MTCGVNSCNINDDRHLWKCSFCNKMYHAACIGVQRQREHLIEAFMIPMCADCQPILRKEADVRKLLYQQEQLVEDIHLQTDTNHRISADLKKFCLVSELFDSIEHLLNDVKATLAEINTNNQNMCSVVGQHMKSCDTHLHTTITGINESNSIILDKITKQLDERLSSLTKDVALSVKDAESSLPHPNNEAQLLEILEEVKFVSGAVSDIQKTTQHNNTEQHQKTLEEELAENSPTVNAKNDHTSPGWRFLRNKWHWRQDWSKFDGRQRSRRRNQKRINQHSPHINHPAFANKAKNNIENRKCNQLDKELLATARTKFAGPPSNTDHPIAALSGSGFIGFKLGETLNPYREKKQSQQINSNESPPTKTAAPSTALSHPLQQTDPTSPGWSLDPMHPPIVSMTQQSALGDGRYLKARLRDPKIMSIVRLYLAYLHDKETSFCHEGMTNTSAKIHLASEGLPTSVGELRNIFVEVHQEYGVPEKAALDDLAAFGRHLSNQRIQHLQRIRESTNKFHNPSFRK